MKVASWTLAAALSWLVIAVIGLFASLITAFLILTIGYAALVFVAVAAVPFVIARGLVRRSGTLALFGATYAFGLAAYLMFDGPGLSVIAVTLVGVGLLSALATWELRLSN